MRRGACIAAALLLASVTVAHAEDANGFYRGKTIRLISSAGVGGGFEGYARAFAAHAPDHIPGKPTMIVESMPGAGGLRATNFLYNTAPKDGTVIGFIHSAVPFMPIYGNKAVHFDSNQFNWLGSMDTANAMCVSWHDSAVKTWDDLKQREFVVGSSGSGAGMEVYPTLLNKLFDTHIRIVAGYGDGTSILLAMERGEVDGRCGGMLTVLRTLRPDWLTEHKVNVPIVLAAHRLPEYPDTPTVLELVQDARTRQMLGLVFAPQGMDRPMLAPPGVPPERVALLQAAFTATMIDPAFRAEAAERNLTLDPISGDEVAAILRRAFATPPDVIDAARDMMGNLGQPE